MSACIFYTDAAGFVIGGQCLGDRSGREGWRFDCAPIKTLEEGGVHIAWHTDERWTNSHYDNLVHPNGTERAA